MSVTTESPTFQSLNSEKATRTAADQYWWNTSGRDISNLLNEANYPEEVQKEFLSYFRETICPHLGTLPDENSAKSCVGWDGNPFEYSFEMKGSTKSPTVRLGVDLSELRPSNISNPLSMVNAQEVVDTLAKRTFGFDDTWYKSLKQWFDQSHLSASEQQALITKAGHQSVVVVGFDIYPRIRADGKLPIMGKVYFPPCFTAAAKEITRWQSTRLAILQLPNTHPNILLSLSLIQDYLSSKPKDWENGARYLATDFVDPSKARLKIYMRHPSQSFDEIWDYYTLGGRIPGHEDDKEKFLDLMNFMSGASYDAGIEMGNRRQPDQSPYTPRRKTTVIVFSLSAASPYPTPKLGIYPANFAPNDEVIAQGIDAWLRKYEWYDGGKSMEERVMNVFTHRKLDAETGIFTFIGIGRKEDAAKKGLSIQAYLTPELYKTPRLTGK